MAAYNKNNAGVKRIMSELRELERDGSTEFAAKPTEEDLFDWHCTIRGPPDTEFAGGLYHARIVLPPEYPFKAPSIMLLTPNGRFELNKKICISFTSYHEDLWQPSWGVRTAIIGLQSFFPVKGEGAMGVGGIEVPIAERKRLAALSREWACPHCGQSNVELLPDPPASSSTPSDDSAEVAPSEATSVPDSDADVEVEKSANAASPPSLADTSSSDPVPASLPATVSSLSSSSPVSIPQPPTTIVPQPPTSIPILPQSQPPILASRPIDLTPSTPAARVLHNHNGTGGVHDHQALMNNLGVHPAVYDHTGNAPLFGDQVGVYVPGARKSPLVLDLAIAGLSALLGFLVLRRFI